MTVLSGAAVSHQVVSSLALEGPSLARRLGLNYDMGSRFQHPDVARLLEGTDPNPDPIRFSKERGDEILSQLRAALDIPAAQPKPASRSPSDHQELKEESDMDSSELAVSVDWSAEDEQGASAVRPPGSLHRSLPRLCIHRPARRHAQARQGGPTIIGCWNRKEGGNSWRSGRGLLGVLRSFGTHRTPEAGAAAHDCGLIGLIGKRQAILPYSPTNPLENG